MKTSKQSIFAFLLIFSFLFLGFLFIDFLALNDIHVDYVSTFIISSLDSKITEGIPEWADIKREWFAVNISVSGKIILAVLNIFFVIKLLKKTESLNFL
jgi:hypothetical protein